MYILINQNIELLLNSTKPRKDIEPYVQLVEQLPKKNVGQDKDYQREYCKYWKLNSARLCEKYLAEYFDYLERCKSCRDNVTVEKVSRKLYEIPANKNGQSLQFSFASKFVHMLNPEQPVYDSMVETFFGLKSGSDIKNFDKKISHLLCSYKFLQEEYGRVLEERLLEHSIMRFREKFEICEDYTNIKVIDTLIWKYVGFIRGGAVIRRDVVYR